MFTTIIAFIVVLGLLVLVHEFGHFITAKKAGLKVEEFGFGFPPRIFGFKRGDTIYSINWIPFGGFVKILGEGGEEKDNPKSFASKPIWVRAIIIAAGVIMNFFLAFVLLAIVNFSGATTVVDDSIEISPKATISESSISITVVEQNSPADEAGIHSGDIVAKVNGEEILEQEKLISIINDNIGEQLDVEIIRGQSQEVFQLTPRQDPPEGQGPLGIGLVKTAKVSYPWYLAIWQGAKQTVLLTGAIFILFGGIVRDLFTTGTLDPNIAGPIGIAVIAGQVLELGFVPLLQFAAVLSINLGIINALPFPALDGGRLLFLLIEKIRRKKISEKVENMTHTIGFGILIILVVLITFRDFFRFEVVDNIKNLF